MIKYILFFSLIVISIFSFVYGTILLIKARDKKRIDKLVKKYVTDSFKKCISPIKLEFKYIVNLLKEKNRLTELNNELIVFRDKYYFLLNDIIVERQKQDIYCHEMYLHKLCTHRYPYEMPCAMLKQNSNDIVVELTNIQSKMRGLLVPYMEALFVTFSEDMKMFLISDLERRYYVSFYRNHENDKNDSWYMHFLDVENNFVVCDEAGSFEKALEKINNYYCVRGISIEKKSEENKNEK